MIRIQFKQPVNGMTEVVCKDISSDLMNDQVFLIRFSVDIVWEVNYKLIKHIGK